MLNKPTHFHSIKPTAAAAVALTVTFFANKNSRDRFAYKNKGNPGQLKKKKKSDSRLLRAESVCIASTYSSRLLYYADAKAVLVRGGR